MTYRPLPRIAMIGFAWVLMSLWAGVATASQTVLYPLTVEVSLPQIDVVKTPFEGSAVVNDVIREQALVLITDLASIGSVWGGHEVHVDQQNIFSVTMQYSGYAPYMAHPIHLRASVTADLGTGEVYRLSDLFADDRYQTVIAQLIMADLEARGWEPFEALTHIRPDQDFYLTPTALVIYFQIYDLLPYVFGFPEFEIPYESIQDLLDPDGPIARLITP